MARAKALYSGTESEELRALTAVFQAWMHLPDLAPLYAMLGAVVAHRQPSPPVWLMLVGPPSCGKSQLLMSMEGLPKFVKASRLTVASLISGTSNRDRAKDSTGGVMREIGDSGVLVNKDFTSVLSLPRETLSDLLSALREIHDGEWSRPVGSDGGRNESWKGKMTFVTACTHAIVGPMGERFVLLRYPESDGMHEAEAAAKSDNEVEMRNALQGAMTAFLDREFEPVEMTDKQRSKVVSMASLAAKCRSAIERHSYSRDVEDTPSAEYPSRLVKALVALWCGMRSAGVTDAVAWKICGRISLDSMPRVRSMTFGWLVAQNGTGHDNQVTRVAEVIKCSRSTARRTLEDLSLHGVLEAVKGDGKGETYKVSEWAMDRYREAYY